ncbi:MAG: hypothetical protein IT410_03235 [Candidatus Doudnabacteria bacterium]|nr:hypothetical protein [Candidatus Doudnabacteria bacterium]
MKAKDYAQQYLEATDKSVSLREICASFVRDYNIISQSRASKGRTSPQLLLSTRISILEELDQKWVAFARIVNNHRIEGDEYEVREDGFRQAFRVIYPSAYVAWENGKAHLAQHYGK